MISFFSNEPDELKMQPTIHLEGKTGYLPRIYPALRSKCIVGCIFNSVGSIITLESSRSYESFVEIM
jgi:hypothetical protein